MVDLDLLLVGLSVALLVVEEGFLVEAPLVRWLTSLFGVVNILLCRSLQERNFRATVRNEGDE